MIKFFESREVKEATLIASHQPSPKTLFRRGTIESICYLEQIGEKGLARLEAKKLVEHLKDAFSL